MKDKQNKFIIIDRSCIKSKSMYYVYVLYKDFTPIYVGLTSNLKGRIGRHKHDKKGSFTTYLVAYQNADKEKAIIAESAIINFVKIINPRSLNKNGVNEILKNSITHI